MKAAISDGLERRVFDAYFVRFVEVGTGSDVWRYLKKTMPEGEAPGRTTVWRILQRLQAQALTYRS